MRRWSLVLPWLLGALGVSACGMIAGLGEYSEGTDSGPGMMGHGPSTTESGAVDDAPAMDPGEVDDATNPGEASVAADGGDDESQSAADGGSPETPDAADGGEDAAGICRSQCSGCCDQDAVCHGGQSLATCGSGGGTCTDCSSSGKVCSSAGACVTASPVDAGKPNCSVGNCKNKCPLLEAPCCKQDQTCGCAVLGLLLCN